MRRAARILIPLLILAVAAAAGAQSLSREEALAALQDRGDVAARRQGAAWLVETSLMADVPLLVQALRTPDEVVRGLAENSLWRVWGRWGEPEVDRLFQPGLEAMTRGDLASAIGTFTAIIQKKPDFAEWWNKRATLYYPNLAQVQAAVEELERLLQRSQESV